MDNNVYQLIKCLFLAFTGRKASCLAVEIYRSSEIYPVFLNIYNVMFATREANPELFSCEDLKKKCEPVAFFPGMPGKEGGPGYNAFPIYLVVPWFAKEIPDEMRSMRGLVVFNRVIGPDPVVGPHFDNEAGLWGTVLIPDEIALVNLPYLEHDRGLKRAMGEKWRDLFWLRDLLQEQKILYKLK